LEPITLIAFLLILSLLVFVHELGHFIVAKRAGITVEEFAIGFPPRAVKLWQEEGSITLDGHEYVIGRNLNVPRAIQPEAQVYAETTTDEKGRPIVTKLALIKPTKVEQKQDQQPRSIFSKFLTPRVTSPPDELEKQPVVTVDALTRPTEYAINWIPFGGYVRMLGEEDPSAAGSFASKSKKIRFAVLVAGSAMNLITAIVFFTLTAMSGVPETKVGTFIAEVVPDTPAAEAGLQVGDAIVGADEAKFKYPGELVSYIDKTKGTEITLHLERDGKTLSRPIRPRANPPEGQGAMGVVINYAAEAEIVVTGVLPDTPAEKAGLQVNDIIVGADEVEFKYEGDLTNYLEQTQGTEITLKLEREGKLITTRLEPGTVSLDNNQDLPGLPTENQILGIRFEYNYDTRINYYSPVEALISGVSQTAQFVGLTFYMPIAILQNILPAEAARVTGPVGIYQQTASAVNAAVSLNWWFPVLWLTAVLSTALAVTNLLPLPALDGGRILFVIIEAIRGKRVAPEKEGAIHFIGLALLLTLMLVISYYDLSSPLPTIDWNSFF
jgi:regulator of sigma E protease